MSLNDCPKTPVTFHTARNGLLVLKEEPQCSPQPTHKPKSSAFIGPGALPSTVHTSDESDESTSIEFQCVGDDIPSREWLRSVEVKTYSAVTTFAAEQKQNHKEVTQNFGEVKQSLGEVKSAVGCLVEHQQEGTKQVVALQEESIKLHKESIASLKELTEVIEKKDDAVKLQKTVKEQDTQIGSLMSVNNALRSRHRQDKARMKSMEVRHEKTLRSYEARLKLVEEQKRRLEKVRQGPNSQFGKVTNTGSARNGKAQDEHVEDHSERKCKEGNCLRRERSSWFSSV